MTRATTVLPLMAAAAAIFALIALMGGVGYAVYDQRETNLSLCQQTVENRKAIRVTWATARDFLVTGTTDPEARARTQALFNAVLRPIPPLECVNSQPVPKEE